MKHTGFTLLELLLYISASTILLLTMSLFLSLSLQSRVKNDTITAVEQEGMAITTTMTQSIRNAQTVTTPTTGATTASLTLTTITPATSPTVYSLSGGTLMMTEGASAAVPLTSPGLTLSNLQFINLTQSGSPATIRIQFTLTRINTIGRNELDYTKTFTATATVRSS